MATSSESCRETVAIVTGGSFPTGRQVARGLAHWNWPVVVVYLMQKRAVDAAIAEILRADGNVVTVRADLADDVDVARLFAESKAAFGGVDVIAHTTSEPVEVLLQHAALHVRWRGTIVSVCAADGVTPVVARQLRERKISVGRAPPEEMLGLLDAWRRRR
jgi:3-oxoacyl-[acyl-carrier protein] reductase